MIAIHVPYARIALAVLGIATLPSGPSTPSAPTRAAISPSDGGALPRGYRLAVAPVPPPPAFTDATAPAPFERGCPVEVRAVIAGNDDPFALVALAGKSQVVRAGSGLSADGRLLSVAAIEDGAVVLRVGEERVRCGLGSD